MMNPGMWVPLTPYHMPLIWIMAKEQGKGHGHKGMRCIVKTKLCYLFKKSLVSWKGRKHKHQYELKKTSSICTNTIREQAASMNKYRFFLMKLTFSQQQRIKQKESKQNNHNDRANGGGPGDD